MIAAMLALPIAGASPIGVPLAPVGRTPMRLALLLIVALALTACGSTVETTFTTVGQSLPTIVPTPGTTAALTTTPTATSAAPVTISGHGISKSKPFHLSGNYAVTWTAQASSRSGCFNGATLKRVDGTFMYETLDNDIFNDSQKHSGSTNLYNLDDADYYIDASSGCEWSYTFTAS